MGIELENNRERIVYLQRYRSAAGGRGRIPPTVLVAYNSLKRRVLSAPDIGGGSNRLGKKAGRSEVLTGVLRSDGVWPKEGAGAGFSAQSKPSAPMSASESRCGPIGCSASMPIPSGTTCSSAHGPSGITNSASVKTASRAAVRRGLAPRVPALQFYQWSTGPIFGSGARSSTNRSASCPPRADVTARRRPPPAPPPLCVPTTPRLARAVQFRPSNAKPPRAFDAVAYHYRSLRCFVAFEL